MSRDSELAGGETQISKGLGPALLPHPRGGGRGRGKGPGRSPVAAGGRRPRPPAASLMAGESLLSPLNRQHNGLRAKKCREQVWAFHG